MINVKILKDNKNIIGFIVKGHALPQGARGNYQDMLCNTVSVLSQSAIIGIEEVLELKPSYVVEEDSGYLKLDISFFSDDEIEKSQILLKTFEYAVESTIISLDNNLGKKNRLKYIDFIKEEV